MTTSFTILCSVVLAVAIFLVLQFCSHSSGTDLVNVPSTIDHREYLVRDMPDKQKAADLLAGLRQRLMTLTSLLERHYPKDKRVQTLVNRFNPDATTELSAHTNPKYTSYSVGKGKQIIFCLRSRDKAQALISEQTLTFVAIHELAHVMTISVGHTEEFWENMRFLLANAIEWKLYTPVNYAKKPQPYCGLQITSSPLAEGAESRAKYVTYNEADAIEEAFDGRNEARMY
jgi:hypothetical protein